MKNSERLINAMTNKQCKPLNMIAFGHPKTANINRMIIITKSNHTLISI
jgi:hypothetical protein